MPDKLGLLQCHLTGHGCGLVPINKWCGGDWVVTVWGNSLVSSDHLTRLRFGGGGAVDVARVAGLMSEGAELSGGVWTCRLRPLTGTHF